MPLNEADTRAKLIDPAIHKNGWTEDLIRREETAGSVEIIGGKARRRARGKIDYILRVKVNLDTQPVALALIEAKKESLPPGHGLDQGKGYAECKRLNVKFIFASNGHQFVEFDCFSGLTSAPKPIDSFPSPLELRLRYEKGMGFALESPVARPLLQTYPGGEGTRRYYQDAAIRAVMEKIAQCELSGKPKRALLSLATGSGKTFIAVNLLKRISDAGRLTRALFVCDRDELRAQAVKAFQNVFGSDAAEVYRKSDGTNNAKNARIHVATYQTLGIESENGDASLLTTFYPGDYFTHVVIDECHRSAWGKWSQVLTRNQNAVHIGLTATPRRLAETLKKEVERAEGVPYSLPQAAEGEITPGSVLTHKSEANYVVSKEIKADAEITANNLAYFGEPAYEYDIAQAIEDGYLAACEIRRFDLFHDDKTVNERESGVSREDLSGKRIKDAQTGETLTEAEARERYEAENLEDRLLMPERLEAMCRSFFAQLIGTGGPEQKTIIFCRRDRHADDVAACLNNLYADWCRNGNHPRAEPYAFKCTAASSGNEYLADLRGASRRFFIATTVDLLTTGVDVPCVRNIVFFKYVRSPIAFYQMVGRGTRIYAPDGKLMFRVYDYTDATRLFGKEFVTKHQPPRERRAGAVREIPPEPILWVEGFEVKVTDAGRYIVTEEDGKAMPVTVEEYKERLAERLVKEAPTLEEFRAVWIVPSKRRELIEGLPDGGRSAPVIRSLEGMLDYDLYDVLAELGYGLDPKTRLERTDAFAYKHEKWLKGLPEKAAAVIQAIAAQFAKAGTEGLENPAVFDTPEVVKAGGLSALKKKGKPAEILMETKQKMFAA